MQSEVLSPQLLYLTFFHDAILIRSAVCKLGYQATLPRFRTHLLTRKRHRFHSLRSGYARASEKRSALLEMTKLLSQLRNCE